MIRILSFTIVIFFSIPALAQRDSMDVYFTFRITEYTINLDDSTTLVQVAVPDAWPVRVKESEIGVLKHRYETGKAYDTTMIGWGRCHLIKEEWHYFAIHLYHNRKPQQGDLLATKCRVPKVYTGLLFNIARHGISLTRVTEEQFYHSSEVFYFGPATEQQFMDSMAADIRFTGKTMLAQNDGQDQLIKGGIYHGKKLFSAMQEINAEDVKKFLKYMAARPSKYAGNVWKIAETFATWMTSETPVVIEN